MLAAARSQQVAERPRVAGRKRAAVRLGLVERTRAAERVGLVERTRAAERVGPAQDARPAGHFVAVSASVPWQGSARPRAWQRVEQARAEVPLPLAGPRQPAGLPVQGAPRVLAEPPALVAQARHAAGSRESAVRRRVRFAISWRGHADRPTLAESAWPSPRFATMSTSRCVVATGKPIPTTANA